MSYQDGYVDVDGSPLYYEKVGAGAPVVLLHGFSLDRRMWDAQWAVVLPGAGHMANLEAPRQFNEIVGAFLAEVDLPDAQPTVWAEYVVSGRRCSLFH